ncbi:MAG: hypothetical protein KR126chlam6_00740 [Candidatus Anoxychlamydiales bacterium]|nr:hypothetical protein [Candidatus Anoxychlamydiales bacterium]
MRNFFKVSLILICIFFSVYADDSPLFNPQTEEEALFLRRVAEFWQDEEFEIARYQIENYINDHQEAQLNDSLYAILGNIYMFEKNYSKAVSSFDNIKDSDIKDKISINLLASLYHLKWHARLIDECDVYVNKVDGELKNKILYLQSISLYNRSLEIKDETEINTLITKAKDGFEKLIDTKFDNQATEYLSQIHKTLNDFEKASICYLDLSEKDPTKKEEYLFQAALLQAHFDKEKALATFNSISERGAKKSNEAAYNKLLLLFEMKRFSTIADEKDRLLNLIDEDKISVANFFIGQAYFNIQDYKNGAIFLEESYLANPDSIDLNLNLAMLMQSAFHLNDLELFNKYFEEFVIKYPDDEKLFESLFAKAMMDKNNEKLFDAKKDFENIISKNFDESQIDDNFLYEYAHLLFLLDETQKSRVKFQEFVQKTKNTDLIKLSLKYIVNCSIKDLQNETDENILDIRKTLVSDIETLLKNDNLFIKEEKTQFKYLLSKTYFDLQNYENSLKLLKYLLDDDSKNPILTNVELSEINLLIAFCFKNTDEDLHEFIRFAQISLELTEDSKHKFTTYINLFNSYLELAKENDEGCDKNLTKAALSLFNAYELSSKDITNNNLVWLSDFFSNKVKNYLHESYKNELSKSGEMLSFAKNATQIYINLLNDVEEKSIEEISLKLSYLYILQDKLDDATALLEKLIQNYRFYPEKTTLGYEETIYELAKVYEKQNAKEQAIALYEEFLPTFKKDSRFKSSSTLHLSRLWLSNVAKEDFVVSNKELEKIISSLKTISFQKIFENEPVHLEAALDYVDVVCYMENSSNWEKRLFLLGRLKDNFTNDDDIISQDYQTMREVLKEKDKLYLSYMRVVDAEKNISLGYLDNEKEHIQAAKKILDDMKKEDLICTKYLEDRIEKNMKCIEEYSFEAN